MEYQKGARVYDRTHTQYTGTVLEVYSPRVVIVQWDDRARNVFGNNADETARAELTQEIAPLFVLKSELIQNLKVGDVLFTGAMVIAIENVTINGTAFVKVETSTLGAFTWLKNTQVAVFVDARP